MPGVLDGVKIVEIAGIGPGPFCGMLLADLGADVVVVERPVSGVEPHRAAQIMHRGKRSITLDLKADGARDIVLKLVAKADGLIEGNRPGVMERLGLGPDACFAVNPALIYGRMTGWGQAGPLAHAAGHDSNYTALAGALWFASPPGTPQHAPPTMLGDVAGGALYLALGLLSGILKARTSGEGQVVDAAIVDGAAHMLTILLSLHARVGHGFARGEKAFDASHWAGRSYRCADGGWINIAPLEPKFYLLLLEKLGLGDDADAIQGQHDPVRWPKLSERMGAIFASKTRAQWCSLLEGSDVCFSPVLDPEEASEHPHNRARQTFRIVDGVLQAAPSPRFSADPTADVARVPRRGEHTREILQQLGLAPAVADALAVAGPREPRAGS